MALKETSSDLDQFNSGKLVAEENNQQSNSFRTVVKVKLYQAQTGLIKGINKEYIQIELEGKDPSGKVFTSYKKQMLNRDSENKLKNWIFEGGETKTGIIYPSVSWEIKELARNYMGEDKYRELKKTLGEGKLIRPVFEALELEMEFKKIISKESGEIFYKAMFAWDKAQDQKWKDEHPRDNDVDPVEADKAINNETKVESISEEEDSDLPF